MERLGKQEWDSGGIQVRYKPYKGLHKDFRRLLFFVIFFLILITTPIIFYDIKEQSLIKLILTILVGALFYGCAILLVVCIVDEYKDLKIEWANYTQFSHFILRDRITSEVQKNHVIAMLEKSEQYFRGVRVVAIIDAKNFRTIKDQQELDRASEPSIIYAIRLANLKEKVQNNEDLTKKECHAINLAILDKLKNYEELK